MIEYALDHKQGYKIQDPGCFTGKGIKIGIALLYVLEDIEAESRP
jgi:hypothetical protein